MPTSSAATARTAGYAVALATCILSMTGSAQGAGDLVPRIQASAGEITRLMGLLKSNDPATRVAAFKEIIGANNPALADLAIETALASEDRTLQALGLRGGFRQVRSLVAKLDARQGGAASQSVVQACGDAVQYMVEKYSFDSGKFDVRGQDHTGVGQVNGTVVSLTIEYGCSFTGTLQPDGSLLGLVSAPYKKGSLPATATFR